MSLETGKKICDLILKEIDKYIVKDLIIVNPGNL